MSKRTTTMQLGEGLEQDRTDRSRLAAVRDEDIDCSDIPELDESFWANAKLVLPEGKNRITVRIDRDVLHWLKAQGPGYQTRINAILRTYMEAQRKR
ncbi:MAG: BrnA antitoxin family protein [Nitrococcus sp.]|nr:BrnA antitoxin family protein [Nitrococcus sp.]